MRGELDPEHRELAEEAARILNDRNRRRRDNYGDRPRGNITRIGMIAEAFVAQTFGWDWDPTSEFGSRHRPDVGHVDVRATEYRPPWLKAHEEDPDWRPVILGHVAGYEVELAGWCFFADAKQPRYWREKDPRWPHPCFVVVGTQLAAMSSLPLEPLGWFE